MKWIFSFVVNRLMILWLAYLVFDSLANNGCSADVPLTERIKHLSPAFDAIIRALD